MNAEQREQPLEYVAKMIQQNNHYIKRFKQRNMEENFGPDAIELEAERDPRIRYMKKCEQNLDKILPIFDKVVKKTLCLQNYMISDGHCQGLADACEFLDHRAINRILLSNCGVSGDQLAVILEGVNKLADFKALIYK